ncbi:hypothetical protein HN876_00560 [archaeon]|jgi:hypothetical protein|nr:hypothetical protein [archaeon]MBT6606439.1 hypothetical protein [archaeon]MBT7251392.1 hypothetical protein [archaeon]
MTLTCPNPQTCQPRRKHHDGKQRKPETPNSPAQKLLSGKKCQFRKEHGEETNEACKVSLKRTQKKSLSTWLFESKEGYLFVNILMLVLLLLLAVVLELTYLPQEPPSSKLLNNGAHEFVSPPQDIKVPELP